MIEEVIYKKDYGTFTLFQPFGAFHFRRHISFHLIYNVALSLGINDSNTFSTEN